MHLRDQIEKELGIQSDFRVEHGYYADGLGIATVTLPEGWEDRLTPLKDENGITVANCVELYDVASAKLAAGREKDHEFLKSLILSDSLDFQMLLDRFILLRDKVENDTLLIRLRKFVDALSKERTYFKHQIDTLNSYIRKTKF